MGVAPDRSVTKEKSVSAFEIYLYIFKKLIMDKNLQTINELISNKCNEIVKKCLNLDNYIIEQYTAGSLVKKSVENKKNYCVIIASS